jgi:hypothetical protein
MQKRPAPPCNHIYNHLFLPFPPTIEGGIPKEDRRITAAIPIIEKYSPKFEEYKSVFRGE